MSRRVKIAGTETVADCKILIVDDFPATRKVIYNYLRDLGFRNIRQAKDGNEAWRAIDSSMTAEAPFELIISDIHMPKKNGLDLLERVREKFLDKHVKFLIISTENNNQSIIKAVDLGATNYIIKPFTFEVFKKIILGIL